MERQPHAGHTPKTHFDQIPVAVVKQIARPDKSPVKAPGRTGTSADAGHFHRVQFYNDPNALCRIVADFIGEGLGQGIVAVLIATPEHATRIESCLRSRGHDVEALTRAGHLRRFDALETLRLFMVDGMPNAGAFRHAIGTLLTQARHGREHCTIRAYGEMVDLLWKGGHEASAIRLETLWNQLGGTHDFELLCGYSMGNFYKGAAIDQIKGQHTHVVSDDDTDVSAPAEL